MGYDETRDRQLFEDSAMSQQPTVPDRLRWLLQTFKYQKNIRIHAFNEEGMEPYPHGWDVWSNGIKAFMEEKGIAPNWIYTSEESDAPQFREHLGIETVLIDPKRTFMNISGAQIRENPFRYWDYIPTEVKPFFVRTVAIPAASRAVNQRWSTSWRTSSTPPARGSTAAIMSSRTLAATRWRCSIPTTTKSRSVMPSTLILR